MEKYLILISITLALVSYFLLIKYICKVKQEAFDWKNKHDTVLSQKKSSEVRLGKIAENLAPLYNWPYNPSNAHFIGQPIDFIQFEDDEIIFIEVKSGNARLSKSQKNIRDIINNKKVSFATYRINETGSKFTNLTDIESQNE